MTARRAHDEQGFVLVTSAIVVVVLILFAGLAVDVSSWYARAEQLQRTADAAALAGVVWMPDMAAADNAALETARRNGFADGVNGIKVDVSAVSGKAHQLKVKITDPKVGRFFSSVLGRSQTVTKASTSEYVPPVPLGSPKNILGSGNLLTGTSAENFWLTASGYCSGHEGGDRKLAANESYSYLQGASECNNGSAASADYDPAGYLYSITLPAAATSMTVEAYDAPYYTSGSPADSSVAWGAQTVTTIFEIYDRNPTPADLSNLTLLKTISLPANTGATTYQAKWANFYKWTSPAAGTYYVRVRTLGGELNSRASNGFSLRAYTGSSFAACTTVSGQTGYSASCPQLSGVGAMSIFVNAPSTTADFYLAQVDAVNAGKTMEVSLFDPGEGASSMTIIDPNGNPVSFSWSTPCNPPTPPTGGCSGSGTSLDVTGTGTQPYTGLVATGKYNDRTVTLQIPLPKTYSTLYGTKTWWKIRYAAGTNPTDRTTWFVSILGDPVHLVS